MEIYHHTMIRLADYPLLEQMAKEWTKATRLDSRACKGIYERGLPKIDTTTIQPGETQEVMGKGKMKERPSAMTSQNGR